MFFRTFKITIFILFLSFCGCSLDNYALPTPTDTPSKVPTKDTNTTKAKKSDEAQKFVSDMVRGVILSQSYSKKDSLWHYVLQIEDMVYEKSVALEFLYYAKRFNVGDLVYLTLLKNDKKHIKDIYLVKKAYKKHLSYFLQNQNSPYEKKEKKRTKANITPWIDIPQSITINLL